jgi:carbamoyl-phosphate synthase large subunit
LTNVLVTAIGGGGIGEQIIKALKLAEPGRYLLFGTDKNYDLIDNSLAVSVEQLPSANDPGYLNALLVLCRRWNIEVLIPGSEQELAVISVNRSLIEGRGIFLPINSTELISLCSDKAALSQRLLIEGFGVPRHAVVRNLKDMESIDWFPLIFKPSQGGKGSANVYIAQSHEELKAIATYVDIENLELPYLIQEYVGTPLEEYTVGVLHDINGGFIDSIALKRDLSSSMSVSSVIPNRTEKVHLGSNLVISSGISQGEIGKFPEITDQCKEIANALGSRGPLNIQCRVVNGEVVTFEINPRYSGTTVFRAMLGFNEPDLLIRHNYLGQEIERDHPWVNKKAVRSIKETILPKVKESDEYQ